MLPVAVRERLQAHLSEVKRQHEHDLADGAGRVILPFALDRKKVCHETRRHETRSASECSAGLQAWHDRRRSTQSSQSPQSTRKPRQRGWQFVARA